MNNHAYRPSFRSLVASLAWAAAPLLGPIIIWVIFPAFLNNVIAWGLTGLMILYSMFLLIQALVVHCVRLTLNENGLSFGRRTIQWSDINDAVMKERRNPVSRTDRVIMIRLHDGKVMNYNLSTLDPSDEDDAIRFIRGKIRLPVVQDRPAL